MRKLFLLLFISMSVIQTEAALVNYKVEIIHPNSHYAHVTLELSGYGDKIPELKMPVWTPGSYMVREFEKNIDRVNAYSADKKLNLIKTDKSTWKITDSKIRSFRVEYDVYCFENTVRTSFINTEHAFLLMTSVLMYVPGQQSGQLQLSYPSTWKKISCTLPQAGDNLYNYGSYDELADSPLEIGNHEIIEFEAGGVKHQMAMVGRNNSQAARLKEDATKICNTMYNIIGSHPCKQYLFIVHHVDEGGGGLEHANSCVVQMPRFNYSNPDKYKGFLGLLAHEYFHLWNVKRIRPAALGPFDYSKENHTNLLWVAEGITSYYDELAMYRAGYMSEKEYLKTLASSVAATLNRKGGQIQSMHEASFDAWIKEYRPTENSINNNISYYLKGSVIAALLDIEIIRVSKGQKNLDNLMQFLYQEYAVKQNRGFTDNEFYQAIDQTAGAAVNFRQWAEQPNDETTLEKIRSVFSGLNLELKDVSAHPLTYTGINTEMKGDRMYVKSIDAGSPAWQSDLQAGDELIAINDIRLKNNLDDCVKLCDARLNFTISRMGLMRTAILTVEKNPKFDFELVVGNTSNELFKKWLSK